MLRPRPRAVGGLLVLGWRGTSGLIALGLLLAPLALPLLAEHNCACGMARGCFCKLIAEQGAHCDMRGSCSMRPSSPASPAPLVASLDLRGWLAPAALALDPGPEPAGIVAEDPWRLPRASSPRPSIPPPRPSRLA